MNCNNCQYYEKYKAKVPTATECPSKGRTMVCGNCGRTACETEILVNYGVCDKCLDNWLEEDGLKPAPKQQPQKSGARKTQ